MGQKRMSTLSILSIENDTVKAIKQYIDVIIKFLLNQKSNIRHFEVFLQLSFFYSNTIILFLFLSCIANVCNNNCDTLPS